MNTMLTASNLMKGDLGHDLGTKVNNTRHLCTQVKDGTMTSTTSENKGHDEQTFIQALRRSFVLVRPWCLAYEPCGRSVEGRRGCTGYGTVKWSTGNLRFSCEKENTPDSLASLLQPVGRSLLGRVHIVSC
jgi:hypothetical protein